jgi:hypothetical protein
MSTSTLIKLPSTSRPHNDPTNRPASRPTARAPNDARAWLHCVTVNAHARLLCAAVARRHCSPPRSRLPRHTVAAGAAHRSRPSRPAPGSCDRSKSVGHQFVQPISSSAVRFRRVSRGRGASSRRSEPISNLDSVYGPQEALGSVRPRGVVGWCRRCDRKRRGRRLGSWGGRESGGGSAGAVNRVEMSTSRATNSPQCAAELFLAHPPSSLWSQSLGTPLPPLLAGLRGRTV